MSALLLFSGGSSVDKHKHEQRRARLSGGIEAVSIAKRTVAPSDEGKFGVASRGESVRKSEPSVNGSNCGVR